MERCVNSIIKGRFQDIEILLIDDGSEQSKAKEYVTIAQSDKRINYYQKTNEGPALARNFGVSYAKGEYIAFVDSDDFIAPYCLVQASEIIKQYHPDLVLGLVEKFSGDRYEWPDNKKTNNIVATMVDCRENLINHMLGYKDKSFIYHPGYISDGPVARVFLRELFDNIKFDEEPYWNEDTIWNIRLVKACKRIVIVEQVWYIYSIYEKSLTQKYRKDCYHEFVHRTEQELRVMEEIWPGVTKGIDIRIWSEIFILCHSFIFHPENTMSVRKKYRLLKKAISTNTYQKVLLDVDFNFKQNPIKRLFKQFLRISMLYKWYYITYFILKIKS